MDLKMNKQDDKLTVAIIGRLDTLSSPEVESRLEPALDGINELVIDLKELEYISSSGLRVLLGAKKAMKAKGGMKVLNPNETVMDVFSVTGFDAILNIVYES